MTGLKCPTNVVTLSRKSHKKLASHYERNGQFSLAGDTFLEAKAVACNCLGSDHPETIKIGADVARSHEAALRKPTINSLLN
jgi:hypothetical protein